MINDVRMQVMADTRSFGVFVLVLFFVCFLLLSFFKATFVCIHFLFLFFLSHANYDLTADLSRRSLSFVRSLCVCIVHLCVYVCYVVPFMQYSLNDDVFMGLLVKLNTITCVLPFTQFFSISLTVLLLVVVVLRFFFLSLCSFFSAYTLLLCYAMRCCVPFGALQSIYVQTESGVRMSDCSCDIDNGRVRICTRCY